MLPESDFTRHVDYPDKLDCKCRKCRRTFKPTYTSYGQEQFRLAKYPYKIKECSVCKESLQLDQFCKKSEYRDGLHYKCKPCEKKYNAPYVPEKPKKSEEIKKKGIVFTM